MDDPVRDAEILIAFTEELENLKTALRSIETGANPDTRDDRGWTALHRAAAGGHLDILERLLAAGANPNTRNDRGETPLHLAAACAYRVRRTLSTTYSPDGSSQRTETIDVEDVNHLAAAGADIDAEDHGSQTPLLAALGAEVEECALTLIGLGASPSRTDHRGYTPLHLAALHGLARTVRQILDRGADPNAQTTAGFTPLDGANEGGHAEIGELLRARGAWRTKDSPGGAADWIRKGDEAAGRGNLEEATVCFDRALQENPRSVVAWIHRGDAEHHCNRHARALESFDEAIAIDATYCGGMAWGNKGCTLQDLGRLDEAVACYELVLVINPRDARAWSNIGTVRNRQGRKADAIEAYRTALELDPSYGPARVYLEDLTGEDR
jgi:ankyrin repeat protein